MSECVELLLSGPNEYTAYQQIASSTPDEKNLPDELLRIFHENAGSILNDFDALNFLAWFFLGSILHFPDSGLMTSMQMSDIQVKFDHMTKSIKLAFLKQNADQQIKVILRSISFNSKDPAKFTDQELNELTYKWNVQYFQLFTFEFDTQHLEILTQYDHFSLQRYFSVQWRNDVDKSELLSKMEKLTRKKVAMEIMNEKVDAQVGTFFQIERNEESKFAETLAQFSIPNPLKVKNNAQLLMSALVMNFQERFALYCTWIPMIHDLQSSMLSVISKYVYNPKLDSNVPLYVTSTNLDTAQKMKRLTTNAGKALLPSYATDSSLAVLSVVNFDLPNQHQISTVEINEGFLNKMLNMYNNPEIHDSIDDVLNVELRFDSELLLNSADSDVFETFLHAQLLALKMPNVKKFKFAHEIPQVTTYALEHGKDMLYLHVHKNYDRDFKNIQHKVFAIGNILEKDDFFNVHIFVGDQSDVFVDKTAKADILARKHTLFTGQVQSMDNIDVPYMLDMLQAQNIHGVKIFTENLFTDYAKQFCKSDAHFRAFLKGIFHPRAVFLSKFEPHSIVAIVPRQISSSENSLTNFLRSPAQNDNILSTGRALLIAYKFLHDESQLSDLVENMSYDFYENYYSRFKFTEHELSPVFMQLISNNGNLVHVSTSRISNGGSRLPSEECGMRRRKRSFSCLTRKSASRIKYLEKLGTAASIGTLALMGKNIVAQVFQGHYLSALVTSSLLITAPLLGIVSHKMAKVASPLVRTAAPFVGKLSSAFVIYDLWQNIKDGSTANILADGTLLILDVAEIGVQLAESFGIIGGVSGILGPVGAALGAVVFIGVDIYTAVHTVEKIQEKIRLTTEERFDEGLRAFFGAPPENRIQKLMQEKEHYQGMFDRTVKFLTENPGLGGYVFPAQNLTNGRWIDEENNYIHMNKERDLGKLGRNRPQLPKNIEFVCFNTPKHPQPAGFGHGQDNIYVVDYAGFDMLPNITIMEKGDIVKTRTLDLSSLSNSTMRKIDILRSGQDLILEIDNLGNIILKDQAYKNLHIVYRSFVFEIADDAHLQPLPIMGHADHLILIENDLPCENLSFELRMITQKIDFLKSNQTLILLVENQNTFFDIILPNFYANDAKFIKTLRFQFENRFVDLASVGEDQLTELNDKIEREKLMQRKAFSFDHIPTTSSNKIFSRKFTWKSKFTEDSKAFFSTYSKVTDAKRVSRSKIKAVGVGLVQNIPTDDVMDDNCLLI
uniref:Uncharacterized protein n=1 Tax=Romanomermis culicivorax TaxID=13658 RepID=A0A915IUD5_ROMCU